MEILLKGCQVRKTVIYKPNGSGIAFQIKDLDSLMYELSIKQSDC
ncbi:hypothetical protein [Pedobacter jejuensis]|nr:hypothetical protein [Pedobacter jejuensis]